MRNDISILYQGIRNGSINTKEALEQLRLIGERNSGEINFSSNAGQRQTGSAEVSASKEQAPLIERILAVLIDASSGILSVNNRDIDPNVELSDYGFDRVSISELINKLNCEYLLEQDYTVVTQNSTLRGFAQYLADNYSNNFRKLSGQGRDDFSVTEKEVLQETTHEDKYAEAVIGYIKSLLSNVIKLPADRIEADAPMEKYGIDSVMVMELIGELEKKFGSLPKTLFYEYQNIKELGDYFIEVYPEKIKELLGNKVKMSATKKTDLNPTLTEKRQPTFPFINKVYPAGNKTKKSSDIAIIGVSGRYPGAGNLRKFWDNLKSGKDSITEIPKERWDYSLYFDKDRNKPGKTYSKWGGFIDDVDKFDPLFFNISPKDAEVMDPQERLFLECVYEAVEDAGYTRETLSAYKGKGHEANVGVFAGVMYEEYQLYGVQETLQGRPVAITASPASVANRVSYFFNFHGPSIALDTMCSSSLTAIHLACQSLLREECGIAVAGGVNISIHPNKYLALGQGNFVSSKGRCESFGKGGDGYVPGEGVGAVILKPLQKAIEDNDRIYAVIKGSAVNHGGKTNGYTVPSPNAQTSVISNVFNDTGIDPRTISYIEAHGTGTSLGDPIEIAGLTKAFRKYTEDTQFCAIGSAKSNIGHCESAAGIAGITKVLLQLKYGQLVPSLHSKILNPYIEFEKTPFVVQQKTAPWKRPVINGREYPRRAGISGFGAGGANAHILIEEYIPKYAEPHQQQKTSAIQAIVVLSAKNRKRLDEMAERLLNAIEDKWFVEEELLNIAYTLQAGREEMEERLAFTAGSLYEISEKLGCFLTEKYDIEGLHHGNVRTGGNGKEKESHSSTDNEKLCKLWASGTEVEWEKLYEGRRKPEKISIPTYPFAKDRYWATDNDSGYACKNNISGLHPLIDRNISDFKALKFCVHFTGREFYLNDHRIGGKKTLPGSAYIEMARAAGELGYVSRKATKLKDIYWLKPLTLENSTKDIEISLIPVDETVEFAITGMENADTGVSYCQGKILFETSAEKSKEKSINIEEIKGSAVKIFSAEECYLDFEKNGLNYGQAFKTIQKLYVGENGVLAQLKLPISLRNGFSDFGLHPGLLDGSFQSVSGLLRKADNSDDGSAVMLPFAIEEIELLRPIREVCYAFAVIEGDKHKEHVNKFNILILDENGLPLVRINGFEVRKFTNIEVKSKSRNVDPEQEDSLLYFKKVWKVLELSDTEKPLPEKNVLILDSCDNFYNTYIEYLEKNNIHSHMVLLAVPGNGFVRLEENKYSLEPGNEKAFASFLNDLWERNQIPELIINLWSKEGLSPGQNEIDSGLYTGVYSLLYLSKALMTKKLNRKILLFHFHKSSVDELQPQYLAIDAFIKTLRLENSRFLFKAIELQKNNINESVEPEEILHIVAGELAGDADDRETAVRYGNDGKRYVKAIEEITHREDSLNEMQELLLKKDGVYLITGGLGGLGLIFAEYLVKNQKITLILTGRSELSPQKQKKLNNLKKWGSEIIYRPVDVSRRDDVEKLAHEVVSVYGTVQGIIHSAGITRDALIPGKTGKDFGNVLAPKVFGTIWLDEVFKDQPLDFFVLFSSVSGVFGNAGQSDYAFANSFMDSYAERREVLRKIGGRQGKSLSINWPLWKDGGMKVDDITRQRMEESSGVIPLATPQGLKGFRKAVDSNFSQVIILDGNKNKITEKLGLGNSPDNNGPHTGQARQKSRADASNVEKDLMWLIVELLKVKESDLDIETDFGDYGMDSIVMTIMSKRIERLYGITVDSGVISENSSVKGLTEYILSLMEFTEKDCASAANKDNREAMQESRH